MTSVFRDIAAIAGLVFTGFPRKPKKDRHIQATSQLFYNVFETYEPGNLLFRQALHEVMERKLEEGRLRDTLERIQSMDICMVNTHKPSLFALPLVSGAHSREVFNGKCRRPNSSNGIRNTQRMTITWHNHNWILDGERALSGPLRDTLILDDLHFGRSAHFQRGDCAHRGDAQKRFTSTQKAT